MPLATHDRGVARARIWAMHRGRHAKGGQGCHVAADCEVLGRVAGGMLDAMRLGVVRVSVRGAGRIFGIWLGAV